MHIQKNMVIKVRHIEPSNMVLEIIEVPVDHLRERRLLE